MLPKPDPELIQYFRKDNEWDVIKRLIRCLLNVFRRIPGSSV